ncbi:MAG: MotA/TolQ/ExbB proton channel family protein [Deltaproteobacteria bacterium]|nr:MotA/TolQ/ExbB proton channel family protein [Deltaproteobacteria bacterium]
MLELFHKGGPVMWPLLVTSLVSVTVIIERLFFIYLERRKRNPALVQAIFSKVQTGNISEAIAHAEGHGDYVARVLVQGLKHKHKSFSDVLLTGATQEIKRFNERLYVLDTVITLAPLLGLFATVTGMIQSFNLLGGKELSAPTVITGGIAEALIGTGFGLAIAIIALIPFNYLNQVVEKVRHEIEMAATHLELLLKGNAS